MIFHGLKTNIALHLMTLLVLAMFLIDFIMIASVQRLLRAGAVSNGELTLAAIQNALSASSEGEPLHPDASSRLFLNRISRHSDISCILILDENRATIFSGGTPCGPKTELKHAVDQALKTGRKVVRYTDMTWGVFWKQRRYLILAMPMRLDGDILAGTGIVLSLDGIYHRLRRVQHMIFIYIFVNTGLLTLIGLYGLSRVTIKPLKALVKRADEYSIHDDMCFVYERETNEFSRLSKALNQMLSRISNDKKKLKRTIASLEKANQELQDA